MITITRRQAMHLRAVNISWVLAPRLSSETGPDGMRVTARTVDTAVE